VMKYIRQRMPRTVLLADHLARMPISRGAVRPELREGLTVVSAASLPASR
jgi:hypothetical protein